MSLGASTTKSTEGQYKPTPTNTVPTPTSTAPTPTNTAPTPAKISLMAGMVAGAIEGCPNVNNYLNLNRSGYLSHGIC